MDGTAETRPIRPERGRCELPVFEFGATEMKGNHGVYAAAVCADSPTRPVDTQRVIAPFYETHLRRALAWTFRG